jgi:hypothetical protein
VCASEGGDKQLASDRARISFTLRDVRSATLQSAILEEEYFNPSIVPNNVAMPLRRTFHNRFCVEISLGLPRSGTTNAAIRIEGGMSLNWTQSSCRRRLENAHSNNCA